MNFRIIPFKPALQHAVALMMQVENASNQVVYRNFPAANLSFTFNYTHDALEKTKDTLVDTPKLSVGGGK